MTQSGHSDFFKDVKEMSTASILTATRRSLPGSRYGPASDPRAGPSPLCSVMPACARSSARPGAFRSPRSKRAGADSRWRTCPLATTRSVGQCKRSTTNSRYFLFCRRRCPGHNAVGQSTVRRTRRIRSRCGPPESYVGGVRRAVEAHRRSPAGRGAVGTNAGGRRLSNTGLLYRRAVGHTRHVVRG
jgi:hypothetical protein